MEVIYSLENGDETITVYEDGKWENTGPDGSKGGNLTEAQLAEFNALLTDPHASNVQIIELLDSASAT